MPFSPEKRNMCCVTRWRCWTMERRNELWRFYRAVFTSFNLSKIEKSLRTVSWSRYPHTVHMHWSCVHIFWPRTHQSQKRVLEMFLCAEWRWRWVLWVIMRWTVWCSLAAADTGTGWERAELSDGSLLHRGNSLSYSAKCCCQHTQTETGEVLCVPHVRPLSLIQRRIWII